mgnify:CR=1 FL=1
MISYLKWDSEFFEKKIDKIICNLIFYQEDFFNPGMIPDLAKRKKLNLENLLKIRVNLALRLVKIHLFTNSV